MPTIHPLLGDCTSFLDALFHDLSQTGIQLDELLELDHLAYRVETLERYEEIKKQLESIDTLVSVAQVNGRPIAVFELQQPLVYKNYVIKALELPAPYFIPYPEGFEHVEFVVKGPLEDFMKNHSHLEFLTKDLSKKINPEIALTFKGRAVKFHLRNLLEAVQLQREAGQL